MNQTNDSDGMMEEENMSVLIATQPGPLQHALQAVLQAMPQVETTHQAGDLSTTLRAVAECHPTLVLLDGSLSGNGALATAIKTIKAGTPPGRCLVLADDVQQQCQVQDAGADVALVKGYPADKLFEIIERLLSGGNGKR